MKKSWWPLVLVILIILGVCGGTHLSCVITSETGEQVTLEDLKQEDFDILKQEVRTLTHLGIRRVFDAKPELKEPVKKYIDDFRELLSTEGADINPSIDKLINGLNDPDIQDSLRLAWLEIQRHGGLQWIKLDAGRVLTPRSAEIVGSMLDGIQDVL